MPDPDIDRVREALREHDVASQQDSAGAALHEGTSVTELDFDGEERFQSLRRQLDVSAFGLNLIRLRPRQRGRIHRHERQEEVYVVLSGTLTLEVEGESRELPTRSAVRVAPGVRRRLVNAGDEPLVLLAIGGAELHAGRDGLAFRSWEDDRGAPPQEVPLPPDLEG
jgi:mannose-6-phosphate isomerase-like protein (cupin superfamily)